MGRIRSIKPEFPHSESMGRVSRDARLLFILLWTHVDDSGKARGNSRILASLLFPYDDDAIGQIDGWLAELEAEGCIARYSHEGSTYIQVSNWLKHQKIDKPTASKIPEFAESSRILANPPRRIGYGLDMDQGKGEEGKGSGKDVVPAAKAPEPKAKTTETWAAYADAYRKRYGVDPVRNAKVSGQLSNLVNRIGAEEAPAVAAYYLRSSNGYYVQKGHSVDCLLADCEKLRTEWATGRQTTQTAARQTDRTASNPFLQLMNEGWTPEAVNERAA